MNDTITMDDFKAMLHATDELTSSSPSGRHYGLYKAIVHTPSILQLHTLLASIPFKYGFILERWKKVTQIMLKKKSQPWIDKLRIIELFEADYNVSIKILMRRLLWYQLKNKIAQEGTYGTIPGGSTHEAMFTRQFTFDIHRITKHPIALIDNDAQSCYDRLIPHLTTEILTVNGLPANSAQTFFNQLLHRKSNVLTGHGISEESISSTPADPLFGIGQGNGAGPAAWHSHLLIMINALQKIHPGYNVNDPTDEIRFQQHIISFVDDTSFILTARPHEIQTLVHQSETLLNQWNDILSLTGGALALADKSKWCLSYYPEENLHGKPHLTLSDEHKIFIRHKDSEPIQLHRIPQTQAERYLGVRIAINGQMDTEYEYRIQTAKDFGQNIRQSSLTKQEVLVSYKAIWLPKITYCLPLTTFSLNQCLKIQSPVFQATLPKLGLNRNFPRAVLYGPTRYGGLAFPNLYLEQGIEHIKWLISIFRYPRQITSLMQIYLRYQQLEAGISEYILKSKHPLTYLTTTWVTHTIEFLQLHNIQVDITIAWLPPVQRENDRYIMDLILEDSYTEKELEHLNKCRLYLQVYLLSDVYTADGKALELWVISFSDIRRKSKWEWPHTSKPSNYSRYIWKRAIQKIFDSLNKIKHVLGEWYRPSHQVWPPMLVEPIPMRQSVLIPPPSSFSQYLEGIPKYQQSILGRYTPLPSENALLSILHDLYDGKLICTTSSSGCVKGLSTYTYLITSSSQHYLFIGKGITSGTPSLISQQRSDIMGHLALFYIIYHLRTYHTQNKILTPTHPKRYQLRTYDFHLKNIPALSIYSTSTKFHRIIKTYTQPYNTNKVKYTLQPDADAITELIKVATLLPFAPEVMSLGIICLKIKQYKNDNDIPAEQSLYEQARQLNETFLQQCLQSNQQPISLPSLPNAAITIYHNNQLLHSQAEATIRTQGTISDLQQYIIKKMKIPDELFPHIDWPSFERSFERTTFFHRVNIAKMVHNWQHTGAQQAKISANNSSTCPNCTEPETADHVYRCKSPYINEAKHQSIDHFLSQLNNIKASAEVIWIIQHYYLPWLDANDQYTPPPLPTRFNEHYVQMVIQEQKRIGFNQLPRGRLSRFWRLLQIQSNTSTLHTSPFSESVNWTSQFISHLWQLSLDLWNIRNESIHLDSTHRQAQKRTWLQDRVVELYRQHYSDNSPLDKKWFSTPMSEKIEENNHTLIKWIQTIEILQHQRSNTTYHASPYDYIHKMKHPNDVSDMIQAIRQNGTQFEQDPGTSESTVTARNPSSTTHNIICESAADIDNRSITEDLIRRHSYWDPIISEDQISNGVTVRR